MIRDTYPRNVLPNALARLLARPVAQPHRNSMYDAAV